MAKFTKTVVDAVNGLLDMSHEARMARAKEMGFDTSQTWYHGTGSQFDAFDPSLLGSNAGGKDTAHGFYFAASPQTADAYRPTLQEIKPEKFKQRWGMTIDDARSELDGLKQQLVEFGLPPEKTKYVSSWDLKNLPPEAQAVSERAVRLQEVLNPYTYDDPRRGLYPSDWLDEVVHGQRLETFLPTSNYKEVDMGGAAWDEARQSRIAREAQGEGYDGVLFRDMQDSGWFGGSGADDIALAFKPEQIRRTDAAFDPAKKDSSNLLASVAGAGVLTGAMLPSEDAEASFIGQAAKTFSQQALEVARRMEQAGASRDDIWRETGALGHPTYKDVDGHWKQEIDDSGFQPRPLYDDANPNYSTSSDPAMWSDWRDESVARERGVPIGVGYELGALAEAYPQLQAVRIKADGDSGFGGSYRPSENLITLPSNDALLGLNEKLWKQYEAEDVVRSTPAHELQHAIQHQEGFAKGGTPSAAQYILERAEREAKAPHLSGWAAANRFSGELGDLYRADYIAKLDQLSKAQNIKPSQITNMSDYYQYSDELRKRFGVLPSKPGGERDAWLQSAAAFFKKRATEKMSWDQIGLAQDLGRKEIQSRIKKLERQRNKYQDDARAFSQVDQKFKQARKQSDMEVYRHLAGEAEARNVETRLNMGMDQRIATPPWQTLDVPEDKLIVHGSKLPAALATAGILGSTAASADESLAASVTSALTGQPATMPTPTLESQIANNYGVLHEPDQYQLPPLSELPGSLANSALETMAGVNRGLTETVDFLTVDQANAIAELLGSQWRAPRLTDALAPATQGNFLKPGTHRDVARTLGEFASPSPI